MNKKKERYSSPISELFVVHFEGGILNASMQTDGIQSLSYDDDELDC